MYKLSTKSKVDNVSTVCVRYRSMPPAKKKKRRDELIHIRLTKEQKTRYVAAAHAKDMDLSVFLRLAADEKIERDKVLRV